MSDTERQIETVKMSPTESENQDAVIKQARALQGRILARRSGRLLPLSWPNLNEMKEVRAGEL